MIINNKDSQNELLGDITEYKASIDIEDINFITTLLSSNLYSRPEESFLREIVSNAWDSHVAAKTTDIPILISVNNDNASVTIRDFGTGLSKKEFEDIYTKIGKSTKRHSNDYIGSFGIGKYAALACSDVVNITSFYNGKKYSYVLIKNSNSITFNLLEETDTEEKNGLSVEINGIDINKILRALKVVCCFPNIFIDYVSTKDILFGPGHYTNFNDIKIKKFNNFVVTSNNIYRDGFLIGNVPYEINSVVYSYLDEKQKNFLFKICNSNCLLTFDIGDFEITPNREAVIYNDTAIEKIKEKLNKAKEEIDSLIKPLKEKECTIEELLKATNDYFYYDFFENTVVNSSYNGAGFSVEFNYLYKNIVVTRATHTAILYYTLPWTICIKYGSIFNPNSRRYWCVNSKINTDSKILICSSRYTPKVKQYLKERYINLVCLNSGFNKQVFEDNLKNFYSYKNITWGSLIDGLWEYLENKIIYLDTENDPDFIAWKLENKSTKKENPINSMILHYKCGSGHRQDKKTFKNINEIKSFIKDKGYGGIVIDTMDNFNKDGTTLFNVCKLMNLFYAGVNKITYDKLETVNIPFRANKESIYKSKRCQKIVDGYLVKIPKCIEHIKLPEHITDFVKSLIVRPYNSSEAMSLHDVGYTLSKEAEQVRQYILNTQKQILDIENILSTQLDDFVLYYGIKNKLFFVKSDYYKVIKENKIIKHLCKK